MCSKVWFVSVSEGATYDTLGGGGCGHFIGGLAETK